MPWKVTVLTDYKIAALSKHVMYTVDKKAPFIHGACNA